MAHRKFHHFLDFVHPILNILLIRIHIIKEIHLLLLRRKHSDNVLFVIKFNRMNVFEHLFQVRLHCSRLFCLRKNFQKIIVG
jgi:hypothetical protein